MNGETTQVQNAITFAALDEEHEGRDIDEISARPWPCAIMHSRSSMRWTCSTSSARVRPRAQHQHLDDGGYGSSPRPASRSPSTATAPRGGGAADCPEALGVNLDQPPAKVVEELEKIGICFMFAQKYHASMKYVGAIRKELASARSSTSSDRLTNPAHPDAHDPRRLRRIPARAAC